MILFRDTGHLANRFAVSQVLIQVTRQPLDATYANMINTIIGSGNLNRVFVALILHGLHGWTRMPGKDNFGNPIVPLITPNFLFQEPTFFLEPAPSRYVMSIYKVFPCYILYGKSSLD